MRYALFTALLGATAAVAQVNLTVLQGIASAFEAAGLTDLSSLAASIVNTTEGQTLLSAITNTTNNITIFAPTNDALSKISSDAANNASTVATLLSYHIVSGPFANASYFSATPNNTILQTFLNDTSVVQLQSNDSQVIAATVEKNTITILNQDPVVNVTNTTGFSNFDILVIDAVLQFPPSIDTVLKNAGLNSAAQAIAAANLTDAIEQAHGVTIFAPTDDAFSKALKALGSDANNATLVQIILQNHIINGTAVYSSEFDTSYTSAGGESIHFNQGNVTTVYSGGDNNVNATVTIRDLLASNGVVHVIDAVLADNQSDPSAASSAFSSATQSSNPSTASGPVGTTPAGSPSNDAILAGRATPVLISLIAVAIGLCML